MCVTYSVFAQLAKFTTNLRSAIGDPMLVPMEFLRKTRRGGARSGAGRPPRDGLRNMPHVARSPHESAHPVHVTVRVRVSSLRTQVVFRVIRAAVTRTNRQWQGHFRICQYSVQSNHLHLIVEASSRADLLGGVKGLCVRIARAANRLLRQRGRFFADRWHGRELTTPRAVRNVIVYVLANGKKHGEPCGMLDPYSSAPYFNGFIEFGGKAPCEMETATLPAWLARLGKQEYPVAVAKTWLLSTGWKRSGCISLEDSPRC